MRNILPPLLQQFVSPLFQLRGDSPNLGDLFDCSDFDSSGGMIAKLCVRELYQGMCGAFIQPFSELFEHLEGSADLSGGWRLHSQVWILRWAALRRRLTQCFSSSFSL